MLIFETERIEQSRIHISQENYSHRKVKYQEQVEAVLNYASKDDQCRSVVLLAYFGQLNAKSCGNCDVCMGDHQSGLKVSEFERISKEILVLLEQKPYPIDKIIYLLNDSESTITKVSRWLLDNGELKTNPEGHLTVVIKT